MLFKRLLTKCAESRSALAIWIGLSIFILHNNSIAVGYICKKRLTAHIPPPAINTQSELQNQTKQTFETSQAFAHYLPSEAFPPSKVRIANDLALHLLIANMENISS